MPAITIILLVLIGILVLANAALWLAKKRNKTQKQRFKPSFSGILEANNLQNNQIQGIQEQLWQLKEYLGKNNGFSTEIKELKSQQESIFSRFLALEEATIQIQNELSEIKAFKKVEPLYSKKEKLPKSNRVKILEEYFNKG